MKRYSTREKSWLLLMSDGFITDWKQQTTILSDSPGQWITITCKLQVLRCQGKHKDLWSSTKIYD